MAQDISILTRIGDLEAFCRRARAHGSVAIDTEFERERTYKPILQLVQAATVDEAVAIDPLALDDLSPLWDLIADEEIETIFHAAGQDLEIFYDKTHRLPHHLFDTQVAAALLGMGEQPGYGDLVRRVLDIRLKKKERITDWGQRPLKPSQLRYALDDVRYLHPLRDKLAARLKEQGRLEWLREELAYYETIENYELDHRRLWLRVSRHRSLDRQGLAILRELADWRERTAARRNLPRNRVVTDEMLVEIARRRPHHPNELSALRRLHPREIARSGSEIVEAVQIGLQTPRENWPTLPAIPEDDPELNVTADLLAVLLRKLTREARIATSHVATKKELVRLVRYVRDEHAAGRKVEPWQSPHESSSGGEQQKEETRSAMPDDHRLKILTGWRWELAGRCLVRLLSGETTLSIDPKALRVELHEER